MEMKHGLSMQQKPTLIMTQRLQQALKLLQMPTLELQQALKQELERNPLLEEVDEVDEVEEMEEVKKEAGQEDSAEPVETGAGQEPGGRLERALARSVRGTLRSAHRRSGRGVLRACPGDPREPGRPPDRAASASIDERRGRRARRVPDRVDR